MSKRITILFLAAGLLAASPAQAQMLEWTDRVFVSINGAYQNRADTSVSVNDVATVYDEQATSAASQSVTSKGGFFDISGGARVWGNVGVGLGFTRLSTTGSADASATVPHPLFYNSARSASTALPGLEHKERQVHIFAMFVVPLTDLLEVSVFGGPTFFKLEQGTIRTYTWSEVGAPYTAINLTAAATQVSVSKTGINIGADVTYRLTRNFGVGGFVRYAGASVPITAAGSTTFDVNIGGVQIGAGGRIRF
ncbi:MAG: hypothetical protein AB1806_01265 [Acidobacteriota bacterium]